MRVNETQNALCDAIEADALSQLRAIEKSVDVNLRLLKSEHTGLEVKRDAAKRAFRLVDKANRIVNAAEAAIARELR